MGFLKRFLAACALGVAALATNAQAADKLFVYVSPDTIGVNAFLQMGKTGIEAAGKKYGADVKTYESKTAADRLENVNAAINEGANIVVLLGFEFNDIVKEVAPTALDTQFLIVDQCFDERPDNVHCAVFREYEASYLMGVAAGMLTEKKKVGVVGALDIPFLHRYTDGYAQGVKWIAPGRRSRYPLGRRRQPVRRSGARQGASCRHACGRLGPDLHRDRRRRLWRVRGGQRE